jgi:hypothetical protein
MSYVSYIRRHFRPYIQSFLDDRKANKDPTFFKPNGTQVYSGRQGSGKTVSAVKHLMDLKERYPLAYVVTNLQISFLKPLEFHDIDDLLFIIEQFKLNPTWASTHYMYFQSMSELEIALVNVNNEKRGVIYVIDEIHTYFNALESKNIPMFVFTEISQQRKQRKLIIGTSQLFTRMAKPFREQCDNIIVCSTKLGIFTTQMAYDGMTLQQDYDGNLVGDVKKRGFFFHNRKIRGAFDTFQKVVSGAEQYEQVTRLDLPKESKGFFKKQPDRKR